MKYEKIIFMKEELVERIQITKFKPGAFIKDRAYMIRDNCYLIDTLASFSHFNDDRTEAYFNSFGQLKCISASSIYDGLYNIKQCDFNIIQIKSRPIMKRNNHVKRYFFNNDNSNINNKSDGYSHIVFIMNYLKDHYGDENDIDKKNSFNTNAHQPTLNEREEFFTDVPDNTDYFKKGDRYHD